MAFLRSESKTAVVCAEDLDEMNIEIMRNTLYKAYLDDFAQFTSKLGGSTSEVMGDLLSFEVLLLLICQTLMGRKYVRLRREMSSTHICATHTHHHSRGFLCYISSCKSSCRRPSHAGVWLFSNSHAGVWPFTNTREQSHMSVCKTLWNQSWSQQLANLEFAGRCASLGHAVC